MKRLLATTLGIGAAAVLFAAAASAHEAHRRAPEEAAAEPAPEATAAWEDAPAPGPAEEASAEAGAVEGDEEDAEEGGEDRHGGIDFWFEYIGGFHPLLVHFPIAFLLAAGAAELLRRDDAASFLVAAAAIAAPIAAALGYVWGLEEAGEYDPARYGWFYWHRASGIATAVAAVLAWYLRGRNRTAYLVALSAAVVLVGVAGFLGGGLTWGPEHLVP